MIINIYAGNKVFRLTDEYNEYHIKFTDRKQLKDILDKFLEGFYTEVYIYYDNINELFKNLKIFFNYQESAGGIVFNRYRQILFLRKSLLWDLPKGKIEKGETIEEAALREVREETGLNNLTIITALPSSYHMFKRNSQLFLKKTYWFKMIYNGFSHPKPLKKEGIIEARWFDPEQVQFMLDSVHPNLISLLKSVL